MSVLADVLSRGLRERINRFQQLQGELQTIVLRRQQIELQLREVDAALKEVDKVLGKGANEAKVYKIIGPILISASIEEVKKELEDKKEVLEVRLKTLEKHEALLKKQVESLRKQLEQELRSSGRTVTEAG
ncbi:MAG: prefoldin subunit beta [Thermoprotei archaeon]|nr:MAG: prefoldin subunit beta [Thermoprotei archaeon]